MAVGDITCDQWRAWLAAALDARATALVGGQVRSITTSGGKRIEYAVGKLDDLNTWIQTCQAAVARCNGLCGGRRAIGFVPLTR